MPEHLKVSGIYEFRFSPNAFGDTKVQASFCVLPEGKAIKSLGNFVPCFYQAGEA
jgi:hypothetical protein